MVANFEQVCISNGFRSRSLNSAGWRRAARTWPSSSSLHKERTTAQGHRAKRVEDSCHTWFSTIKKIVHTPTCTSTRIRRFSTVACGSSSSDVWEATCNTSRGTLFWCHFYFNRWLFVNVIRDWESSFVGHHFQLNCETCILWNGITTIVKQTTVQPTPDARSFRWGETTESITQQVGAQLFLQDKIRCTSWAGNKGKNWHNRRSKTLQRSGKMFRTWSLLAELKVESAWRSKAPLIRTTSFSKGNLCDASLGDGAFVGPNCTRIPGTWFG